MMLDDSLTCACARLYITVSQMFDKGCFKKTKTVNLGLWPKLGTGSEGPIELFCDQKCQNNESKTNKGPISEGGGQKSFGQRPKFTVFLVLKPPLISLVIWKMFYLKLI